jgi:hypothetical protein
VARRGRARRRARSPAAAPGPETPGRRAAARAIGRVCIRDETRVPWTSSR